MLPIINIDLLVTSLVIFDTEGESLETQKKLPMSFLLAVLLINHLIHTTADIIFQAVISGYGNKDIICKQQVAYYRPNLFFHL